MKLITDTVGSITHDRFTYFSQSIYSRIMQRKNTWYKHLPFSETLRICPNMSFFVPHLVSVPASVTHFIRFHMNLYYNTVFSISLKIFSHVVVPWRIFCRGQFFCHFKLCTDSSNKYFSSIGTMCRLKRQKKCWSF